MATLSAVADILTSTIQITGLFPDHPDETNVSVYRVLPDGTETLIRGGDPTVTSGFGFVLYDNEAPLNTAVWYRAEVDMAFLAYDLFTRTEAAGTWGIATSGQTWTGGSAQLSANGTTGLVTHNAANQQIFNLLNITDTLNQHVRATVKSSVVATGAELQTAILTRYDGTSYYLTRISWGLSGLMELEVTKSVSGVDTALSSIALPQTYTGAETFWIAAEADGTTLRAKSWPSTIGEPEGWMIELPLAGYELFTATNVGIRSRRETGNINANPAMEFDNYYVYDLDDTEEAISNTVVLASGDDGWIKSPLYPLDNLRLDNCDVHSPKCLQVDQNVFFQRLDVTTRRSATGVFDIIGDPKARTVAMPRKAQTVDLTFVSRQLSSIPGIEELFNPGANLLLQLPERYGWGISTFGSEYVSAGDNDEVRISQVEMGKPYRSWTVPLTVVHPPADTVSGVPGGAILAPQYATLNEMMATGKTYLELASFGLTTGVIDTFTDRTVANGWGSPEFGAGAWANAGGVAADFAVANGVGTHTHTAVNTPHITSTTHGSPDSSFTVDFMSPVTPTGSTFIIHICSRYTTDADFYTARLTYTTAGNVQLNLEQRVASVFTSLTSNVTIGSTEPGVWWRVFFETAGTSLQARIWRRDYDSMPSVPQAQAISSTLVTGNNIALRSNLSVGVTNALPLTFSWDNVVTAQGRTYRQWTQGDWD